MPTGVGRLGLSLAPAEPPFPVTAPHRVVPAPKPLGEAPHVVLDDAWPTAATRRLERLGADRDGCIVRDPQDRDDDGLLAALRAAWALLPFSSRDGAVALPHLGLEVQVDEAAAVEAGPSMAPAATARLLALTGMDLLLEAWLLSCSDDLVVLRRSGPGALRCELLAVFFPSGWPVRQRAGATLGALHAPVADGARLQAAEPALSEALLTKGPFVQHVWGMDRSGRLDQDPCAPDAEVLDDPPPQGWWLRVERQTTLPLPGLDRALFTIRPHLVPLPSLSPDQRRVLGEALASLSDDAATYKGVAESRHALVPWLMRP